MEVFSAPRHLKKEFLSFYENQRCYSLSDLAELRSELREHVGVYLLYYHGEHELYACIVEINRPEARFPIYVGKAVESGRRTGSESQNKQSLYGRLREHMRSIQHCQGLAVQEFSFKALAVESDLVTWGETTMIKHFQPAWNQIIEGFGIHAPGKGRYLQEQSVWDVLHPGRRFTSKMPNIRAVDKPTLLLKIKASCQRFLSGSSQGSLLLDEA